jgi:pimeloyl-ACP methyl ester carboxylesterase
MSGMRSSAANGKRGEIVVTWLNASFEMRFRLIGGLTVRFAASEDHGDQALLLSPWPESLLAFEPVWWCLATRTHLVALDLPGFGHSQRRDSLLSPAAMGEFISAAADAFGLTHPHIVAPGTGTAAALFAAARHPGHLRSLVVGSGPARSAESVRYLRSYPAELPVLASLLPRIQTPEQIIAGARDTAIPPVNAAFLHERPPHSKLDVIDASHFTWEDAAAEYAALVTGWWRGLAGRSRK